MNRYSLIAFASAVTALMFAGSGARISVAAENQVTDVTVSENLEPQFSSIVPAKSLLGLQAESSRGKSLGQVADVVLDLELGRVAFFLVKQDRPADGKSSDAHQAQVAIPAAGAKLVEQKLVVPDPAEELAVQKEGAEASERIESLESPEFELTRSLNRGWAESLYIRSRLVPYWENEAAAKRAEFDRKSYPLTLLSGTNDREVIDPSGKKLGEIAGLALSLDNAQVAYAVVRLHDSDEKKNHYAVPLGVFVVPQADGEWIIELDEEAISRMQGFGPSDSWPMQLDRGWIEYVHLRYGRSPLGGVQHKAKESTARK